MYSDKVENMQHYQEICNTIKNMQNYQETDNFLG